MNKARGGQPALDVALSLDETYADVAPVREGSDGISAFVSIMRGCNNMSRLLGQRRESCERRRFTPRAV